MTNIDAGSDIISRETRNTENIIHCNKEDDSKIYPDTFKSLKDLLLTIIHRFVRDTTFSYTSVHFDW